MTVENSSLRLCVFASWRETSSLTSSAARRRKTNHAKAQRRKGRGRTPDRDERHQATDESGGQKVGGRKNETGFNHALLSNDTARNTRNLTTNGTNHTNGDSLYSCDLFILDHRAQKIVHRRRGILPRRPATQCLHP